VRRRALAGGVPPVQRRRVGRDHQRPPARSPSDARSNAGTHQPTLARQQRPSTRSDGGEARGSIDTVGQITATRSPNRWGAARACLDHRGAEARPYDDNQHPRSAGE
jgi:hypothetical protein